jgi:metal-responsive CopG/Arc/MetJ family transcriptional regulator
VKDKNNSSVVKVDSELLEKVDKFIQKKENKLKFVNKKQFIDLAVESYLEELKKEEKNEK